MGQEILFPTLVLGGLGIAFGLLLGYAAKRFYVEADPRVAQVRELLPGANCGGCGFPGCDGFADALVSELARATKCAALSQESLNGIAAVLGVDAGVSVPKIAFVKCQGTPERAPDRGLYVGVQDCREAVVIPGGGQKLCPNGCLGWGTCTRVCPWGAMQIVDHVAQSDPLLCVGCGACASVCPKNIIEVIPKSHLVRVTCSSTQRGADAKKACSVACIGCGLCVRTCPVNAITLENNLARIDPEKCTQCRACVAKCPTKAIVCYMGALEPQPA